MSNGTLSFFIAGSVPSKKNSKRLIINRRTNKPMILSSKNHCAWEQVSRNCLPTVKQLIDRCNVTITFVCADKRKRDLTNMAESIMDLIAGRIIVDDNYFCVGKLTLVAKDSDKLAAGALVEIEVL